MKTQWIKVPEKFTSFLIGKKDNNAQWKDDLILINKNFITNIVAECNSTSKSAVVIIELEERKFTFSFNDNIQEYTELKDFIEANL